MEHGGGKWWMAMPSVKSCIAMQFEFYQATVASRT